MKKKRYMSEKEVERRNKIKKNLQGLIFPTVLCCIVGGALYFIVTYQNQEVEKEPVPAYAYAGDEKEIVMENNDLVFRMDPLTTTFTIEQKSTGKIWCSNAAEGSSDPIALGAEKAKLQSNLIMSYAVTNGLETTYDSFSYSVENGIYEIEQDEASKTVKVYYSLGNVEKTFTIPPVITATELEGWLANMEEKGAKLVKDYYKKYDINKLGKKDDKDALLEAYPIMETEVIYVLRDTTKEKTKAQIADYFEAVGYTYENYLANLELDHSSSGNDTPVFNIEMDFTLADNDLVVTIPMQSMQYDPDTPIYTVTPLPYFGAASTNQEGYILVPEGGGALINYNNGKTSQSAYYANMYGRDMCLFKDAIVHNTRAYFNVFGQGTEGSAYLCYMEDGVSYAGVNADISGRVNSYNSVNAKYSIASREKYKVGDIANSDIYVYLENLPEENIVQRYRFYDTDDYVELAKDYRAYLEAKNPGYFKTNNESAAPVSVEIVGAIDKVKQILGVPVSRPLELTNFKEAEGMISDLANMGIGNLYVKYSGWCNGGVNQKILKRASLVSDLGSAKELKQLVQTANGLGVNVYLNGVTQYEFDSDLLDGFFAYRDAAKYLTKDLAEQCHYSHVTYAAREAGETFYLLHTELAQTLCDNLKSAADKYGAGISYQDLGMDLSSDFYRKNTYSREATRNLQIQKLKEQADAGANTMINMGNDFAIPYVDFVTNMDLKGSNYTILDKAVPFYQIAIHGYVNYSGDPLNICGNEEEELLNSAEYGAGLNFTLMDETSFTLQKTLYPEYYGSEYDQYRDRILTVGTRYNRELGHVFGQEMVGHEVLSDTLTCTTYADGTKVYVNYSFSSSATLPNGSVVEARDYKVVR